VLNTLDNSLCSKFFLAGVMLSDEVFSFSPCYLSLFTTLEGCSGGKASSGVLQWITTFWGFGTESEGRGGGEIRQNKGLSTYCVQWTNLGGPYHI